ncbi:AMED_5909 family protein [Phytohabitans kaempferiae]|uniref:AMED_5909 family protein n=1 Tax=Phytohabitans kaempferiae TaxID=1620943 RepID=A0ABV6LVB8_9ACTN
MASFAAELSALLRTMPGLNSSDGERAAWFDRKADLFQRIANTDGHLSAEAVELAGIARQRAAALREGRS